MNLALDGTLPVADAQSVNLAQRFVPTASPVLWRCISPLFCTPLFHDLPPILGVSSLYRSHNNGEENLSNRKSGFIFFKKRIIQIKYTTTVKRKCQQIAIFVL